MQGRARGRKGERKTYHINPYHHITMEFGGYLLNVAKTPRAQERARAKRKASYPTKKQQEFSTTPNCPPFNFRRFPGWRKIELEVISGLTRWCRIRQVSIPHGNGEMNEGHKMVASQMAL